VTPSEVAAALDRSAIVLDMRPPRPFAAGHLPGAINVQFNRADLVDRTEMVLPRDAEYVVHAEPNVIALAGVVILRDAGFKVAGHIAGGLRAWETEGRPVEHLPLIDVDELRASLDRYVVIDARDAYEYRHGHIAGAFLLPSGEAWTRAEELGSDLALAVVCGNQVRSSLVASILLRAGRQPVLVMGGMVEWLERAYPIEKAVAVSG
jgi:hydroxyacylglutathione hydrolase